MDPADSHVTPEVGTLGNVPESMQLAPLRYAGSSGGRVWNAESSTDTHLMPFPNSVPGRKSSAVAPAYYRLQDVIRAECRFPAQLNLGGKASEWSRESFQAWTDDLKDSGPIC